MKKLLLLTLVLLVSGAMLAQGSKETRVTKSILAFHGGPSFPMGDFKDNNIDNEEAGFAKTGFTIDLNYGYQFHKNAGIAAGVFFNKYKASNVTIEIIDGSEVPELVDLKLDNWQFYGITAGPMLTFDLAKSIAADLRVMGGIANAKTPTIVYEHTVAADKDWSVAPVIQGGLNLRIGTSNSLFVFAGVDYMYMKPKFDINFLEGYEEDAPDRVHQKISVLNLTGGIGIKF